MAGRPAGGRRGQQRGEKRVLGAVVLAEVQQGVAARQQGGCVLVPGALSDPRRPRGWWRRRSSSKMSWW